MLIPLLYFVDHSDPLLPIGHLTPSGLVSALSNPLISKTDSSIDFTSQIIFNSRPRDLVSWPRSIETVRGATLGTQSSGTYWTRDDEGMGDDGTVIPPVPPDTSGQYREGMQLVNTATTCSQYSFLSGNTTIVYVAAIKIVKDVPWTGGSRPGTQLGFGAGTSGTGHFYIVGHPNGVFYGQYSHAAGDPWPVITTFTSDSYNKWMLVAITFKSGDITKCSIYLQGGEHGTLYPKAATDLLAFDVAAITDPQTIYAPGGSAMWGGFATAACYTGNNDAGVTGLEIEHIEWKIFDAQHVCKSFVTTGNQISFECLNEVGWDIKVGGIWMVLVGGSWINIAGDTTPSSRTFYATGVHEINTPVFTEIRPVLKNTGNLNSETLGTLVYADVADAVAPTISIASPTSSPTYITNVATIAVSGTASDDISVTSVTWSNDRGGSGTASGTTAWSIAAVALLAGANVVTVTAWDAAGNSTNDTLTVTYDITTPITTITSPTSATTYFTNTSSLNIAGTASDNIAVSTVVWSNSRGGSGSAVGTTAWSVTGIVLQIGSNAITVTATDTAGNSSSDVLTVTYDVTPPSITITVPSVDPTYFTSSSAVSISGVASDNVGLSAITWSNNRGGSGTASGTSRWGIVLAALQSGANVFTATATDRAGNTSTDVITITYDSTVPSVNILTPTAEPTYFTNVENVVLTGTASDNVGVTQVTWANDVGESSTAEGTTSWVTGAIFFVEGQNVITITAYDAAGGFSTDQLIVTYDIHDPTITIVSPTTEITYTSETSVIGVSGVSSDNVGVALVTWANDLGGNGTATGTTAWAATIPLFDGINVITVTAFDATGNHTSTSIAIAYTSASRPQAIPAAFTVEQGQVYNGAMIAVGSPGETLTYSIIQSPSQGILSINSTTGAFAYQPNTDALGADSFTFMVTGVLSSDPATISITISAAPPIPSPPQAISASFTVEQGHIHNGTLTSTGPQGETLTYSIVQSPSQGILSINSTTGAFTYQPNTDALGADSFTFMVTGVLSSDPATISIIISATPPTPPPTPPIPPTSHNIYPENVVICYREEDDDSLEVAQYYRSMRTLPLQNMIPLPCVADHTITEVQYIAQIRNPLIAAIEELDHSAGTDPHTNKLVWVIVLGFNVPNFYVDSYGETIPIASRVQRLNSPYLGKVLNPVYNMQIFEHFTEPTFDDFYITSILDGPDVATVKSIVTQSLISQNSDVLTGKVFLDPYGLRTTVSHIAYQTALISAESYLSHLGLDSEITVESTTVDATFRSFANDSFYWGWYTPHCSKSIFTNQNEKRIFLYNADDNSASNIRETSSSDSMRWCNVSQSISPVYVATAGATQSPGVDAYLLPEPFFKAMHLGSTLGEAFMSSCKYLDWKVVLIGDPMLTVTFPGLTPLDPLGPVSDPDFGNVPGVVDGDLLQSEQVCQSVKECIEDSISYRQRVYETIRLATNRVVMSANLDEKTLLLHPLYNWMNNLQQKTTAPFARIVEKWNAFAIENSRSADIESWFDSNSEKTTVALANLLNNKTSITGIATEYIYSSNGFWHLTFYYLHPEGEPPASLDFMLEILNYNSDEVSIIVSSSESRDGWEYEIRPNEFVSMTNGFPSTHSGRRVRYNAVVGKYLSPLEIYEVQYSIVGSGITSSMDNYLIVNGSTWPGFSTTSPDDTVVFYANSLGLATKASLLAADRLRPLPTYIRNISTTSMPVYDAVSSQENKGYDPIKRQENKGYDPIKRKKELEAACSDLLVVLNSYTYSTEYVEPFLNLYEFVETTYEQDIDEYLTDRGMKVDGTFALVSETLGHPISAGNVE